MSRETQMTYDPYHRLRYMTNRIIDYYKSPFHMYRYRICDLEGKDRRCGHCGKVRELCYHDTDPYAEEIMGDYTVMWICESCYEVSCDEI